MLTSLPVASVDTNGLADTDRAFLKLQGRCDYCLRVDKPGNHHHLCVNLPGLLIIDDMTYKTEKVVLMRRSKFPDAVKMLEERLYADFYDQSYIQYD